MNPKINRKTELENKANYAEKTGQQLMGNKIMKLYCNLRHEFSTFYFSILYYAKLGEKEKD